MNFCILIELSKKKISFLYNRSDGESKFTPFVGEGSALPLAIYCLGNDMQIGQFAIDEAMKQNPHAYTDVFQAMKTVGTYKYKGNEYHYNTLLKNAIEKYLKHFFDSVLFGQNGRLEQNIASMPLCFVFNSDIDENERLFVRNCFAEGGYSNLATIDYDQIVVEASNCATNHAVCVTSDGKDLFMCLYETKTHKYLGSAVMANRGKDPRVESAVTKLWESLGYENYYLNFEAEKSILTKLAEEFLSSGELELQQNVLFTDGYSRECFLSMRELNEYRYNDDGKIVSDLKNLLVKQNISPLDCTVVLKGKAANNGYFKHIFNGEFNALKNVNDSFRREVLSQLLKDIKEENYKFNSGVTKPSSCQTKPDGIEPIHTPNPPVLPSGLLKREVRGKIAEIKGKMRIKNYVDAKKLANILLDYLHEQGFDIWDNEVNSILKEIPIGGTVTKLKSDEPKDKGDSNNGYPKTGNEIENPIMPDFPKEDWKKCQRDVRRQIAEAKAMIRKGDLVAAKQSLVSLKDDMNAKRISEFDNSINEIIKEISETTKIVQTGKTATAKGEAKKLSEAERLLTSGRFPEAKRAFASEGNSAMAQVCSELIKSKRTINLYQSGLDSAIRSKNKNTAATAIRELSNLLKIYKTHNVDSTIIEELINKYKIIK